MLKEGMKIVCPPYANDYPHCLSSGCIITFLPLLNALFISGRTPTVQGVGYGHSPTDSGQPLVPQVSLSISCGWAILSEYVF